MKKTIFSSFAAIVSALAMTLSFTSCEKDNGNNGGNGNDNENTDAKNIENISAAYYLQFSEDVLKFYDITVNYGADGETEKTEKVTETKWSVTRTYSEGKLPASVFCKAVMTPKADHPAIDPETVYTVTRSKNCSVSATYKNGKTSELNSYSNSSSNPFKGTKFEEHLKHGEQTACDYSYTIKY